MAIQSKVISRLLCTEGKVIKMNQNLIANALSLTLFTISLFISLRAFYIYFKSRSPRLFILGLSMFIIALTAIASYIGDNITSFPINLGWFKYTGQTVCFLLIVLSLVRNSDKYLRSLMIWQVVACVLLMVLLTPIMPAEIPATVKIVLGGSRSLICGLAFFFYVSAFMTKETFFSFLMSLAFLALSTGYVLNIPKYSNSHLTFLDNIGDSTRIFGLVILLIAIFV